MIWWSLNVFLPGAALQVVGLKPSNSQDYVYAAFFLICTSTFLNIRWWLGSLTLAAPLAVRAALCGRPFRCCLHCVLNW